MYENLSLGNGVQPGTASSPNVKAEVLFRGKALGLGVQQG